MEVKGLLCGNQFREFSCDKLKGHVGAHSVYIDSEGDASNETCFVIHEWNDHGQTPNRVEVFEEFNCDYDLGRDARNETIALAIERARLVVAEGVVFEIRAKPHPDPGGANIDYRRSHISRRDMAESWGVCFYSVPSQPEGFEGLGIIKQEPILNPIDFDCALPPAQEEGYVLIARMVA